MAHQLNPAFDNLRAFIYLHDKINTFNRALDPESIRERRARNLVSVHGVSLSLEKYQR